MCMQSSEGVECMNAFVCLLMFVFSVCLTAVVLSVLFANMLVHEWLQGSRNMGERQREMEREGETCQGMLRHMGPPQKGKLKYTLDDFSTIQCVSRKMYLTKFKNILIKSF